MCHLRIYVLIITIIGGTTHDIDIIKRLNVVILLLISKIDIYITTIDIMFTAANGGPPLISIPPPATSIPSGTRQT